MKLGLLDHDTVETVACAPDNRLRISCYLARHFEQEWDFQNDTAINVTPGASKSKPGAEHRALAVVRAAIKRRNPSKRESRRTLIAAPELRRSRHAACVPLRHRIQPGAAVC